MFSSRSQVDCRASDQPLTQMTAEGDLGSDREAAEPSAFPFPDQYRTKYGKALLGLSAMLAISLSFYAYHHLDALIARASVGHHAHYAPAEDSSLHEVR